MSEEWYLEWIEKRRTVALPDEMPDRVMQVVLQEPTSKKRSLALRMCGCIERSRIARCVAYGAAMLIGSTPFMAYFGYLMLV
jgi:hypothetical protein